MPIVYYILPINRHLLVEVACYEDFVGLVINSYLLTLRNSKGIFVNTEQSFSTKVFKMFLCKYEFFKLDWFLEGLIIILRSKSNKTTGAMEFSIIPPW